jgi:hypothetical protein
MKKRIVFFIALFAMSAFINAASVTESSSGSVSQEMIASTAGVNASAQQDPLTCQNRCQLTYLYCTYGGWPVDCNAMYINCLAACP